MKLRMYATTIARCVILFILLLFSALFFAMYVVCQVAELYLQGVLSFYNATRTQLIEYEKINRK